MKSFLKHEDRLKTLIKILNIYEFESPFFQFFSRIFVLKIIVFFPPMKVTAFLRESE